MLPRQELADDAAENRGAAKAAADQHAIAEFALFVFHDMNADVVHHHSGAIILGAVESEFEFTRQIGEFRMEGTPLAHDLGVGTRIDDFVGCDAGVLVGGVVAHVVARGLDRMHFDRGKVFVHVGHVFQADPVELDILAGREVTVAAVVLAGDERELAQLRRRQHAVRNGDTVHVRVALHVQPVLQAKREEFLFGQLIGEAAANLIAELGDAFLDDQMIILVVAIHQSIHS